MVETKKDTSGLPAPAITVTVMPSNRSQKAARFHSSSSVEDCIKANTFNRSMILHDVVLGFTKRESVGGLEEYYTEDYTASLTGFCFFWFLVVSGSTQRTTLQLPRSQAANILSTFPGKLAQMETTSSFSCFYFPTMFIQYSSMTQTILSTTPTQLLFLPSCGSLTQEVQ